MTSRRPLLLTLAQFVALFAAVFILFRVARAYLAPPRSALLGATYPSFGGVTRVLGFAAICVAAAWSIQARRRYAGPLAAVVVLSLMAALALSRGGLMLFQVLVHGASAYHELPPPYIPYGSQVQVVAAAWTNLVALVLLVAWGIYLAFSGRVAAYLGAQPRGRPGGA